MEAPPRGGRPPAFALGRRGLPIDFNTPMQGRGFWSPAQTEDVSASFYLCEASGGAGVLCGCLRGPRRFSPLARAAIHRPTRLVTLAPPMRKQYHFWPSDDGVDAWDVDRLVELSRDLTVEQVPLTSIWEVDTAYWSQPLTVRDVADHVRLVQAVDLSYPIILGDDGRVMDGMHRVVRALLEGRESIAAVRFEVQPEPDYRNCEPDTLPYPDSSA